MISAYSGANNILSIKQLSRTMQSDPISGPLTYPHSELQQVSNPRCCDSTRCASAVMAASFLDCASYSPLHGYQILLAKPYLFAIGTRLMEKRGCQDHRLTYDAEICRNTHQQGCCGRPL